MGLDPVGVAWALVSVAAFAAAGVLNRVVADKGWGTGLTIGLSNLLAALVFGLITLLLFGPAQFLHLRWWWLMGVLLVYTAGISLGGELLLLFSYRDLGATSVALWGNAGVLVSLLSAHLLLGERLGPPTFVGAGLILAALLVGGGESPQIAPQPVGGPTHAKARPQPGATALGGAADGSSWAGAPSAFSESPVDHGAARDESLDR